MTPTITPKDMTLERAELAAFVLFETLLASAESRARLRKLVQASDDEGLTGNLVAGREWRSSALARDESRALSASLTGALTEAGFSIKPPPDKQVEKAVTNIMTQPASLAYQLYV